MNCRHCGEEIRLPWPPSADVSDPLWIHMQLWKVQYDHQAEPVNEVTI